MYSRCFMEVAKTSCFSSKDSTSPLQNVAWGDLMRLKCRLRVLLAEMEMTQQELIQRMDKPISNSAMSQIVRGDSLPTLPTAISIAKAIGKPVEEIWVEASE